MDVAVTGSTGFIGTALTKELEAAGHRVLRVVRPQTSEPVAQAAEWDPPAGKIDAEALEGIDAVIHLAGVLIGGRPGTKKQLRLIRESRTVPTELLARTLAGLQRPPRVLLSQSAVGYYGDRGDDLLSEDEPAGTDFLATVCRDWEAATEPAAAAGIRVVRARTGIVLHPDGGLMKRLLLPARLGLAPRLGDGRQWQSWITLRDQVAAMMHVLGASVEGPINVAGPNPVRNAELTEAIARAVGRKARFAVPQPLLNLGAGRKLGESATGSQKVDVSRLLATGFRHQDEQLDEALRVMLG